MLLDDPLKDRRGAVSIPGAVRVNYSHRTLHADLQAIGFRSINAALARQIELLESRFKVSP